MKFISLILLILLTSLQINSKAHATIVIHHEVGQKVQGVIEVSRKKLFGDKKINIPLPVGVWNVQIKEVANSTHSSPIEGITIILDQTESGKMISGMWLSIYPHDRRNWIPGPATCKGRFLSKERGSSINGYCHSLKDIPLLTNAKSPTQIKIRENFRSRGLDWPARALMYESAFEASPDFAIYMYYTITLPVIGLEDSLTTLSSSIEKTEEWWKNNSNSGSVKNVKEWYEAYAEEIFLTAQGKGSTNSPILKESIINKLALAVTGLKIALPELNNKIVQEARAPNAEQRSVESPTKTKVETPDRVPPTIRSSLSLSASSSIPDEDGLVTLNITTNSDTASLKIDGEEAGGRADGRYSVNRFAKVGSNSFEVIATDRYGNTKKQTVVVNREVQVVAERTRSLNPTLINAARPRDAVAIIIGIEKYKRVSDADFANNDANAFYDYARRALGIKPENIRLLVDDKADAAEILRAFKTWLPTRVNKNTTDVYVFYSGHGLPSEDGGSLYFLPHEVDRDLLERTAITQKEVVQAIQRTTPKSVTMFIDSCYSGQSRTGETLLASARPISIAPKASTDFPPNFMVISASAPDQISSSSPELKHGIFSYYLMLGMEGEADVNKDGQITVGEMQAYLAERVPRRAMSLNRTQLPQTVGDESRVLVGR